MEKIEFILPFFSSAYIYNISSAKCYKRRKFICAKYTSNVTNDVIHACFGLHGQVIAQQFLLCLPANCCQRFQSWESVGNFLFLRDYWMEIKKRREKIRQYSSCKSSYLQEKRFEMLFNLLSQLLGNKFEIWDQNTSQTPNRWSPAKTGAIPLHTHSPFFPFKAIPLSKARQSTNVREKKQWQGSLAWTEKPSWANACAGQLSYQLNNHAILSFFSSRRRHTRLLRVSWARRCV